MRKVLLISAVLLISSSLYSDSVLNYTSDFAGKGMFLFSYQEKYFEYNTNYAFLNLDDMYYDLTKDLGNDMLRGMDNKFSLRYGVSDDLTVGAEFRYIFQKLGEYNHNNLHTISLMAEKNIFEIVDVMLGMRFPLKNEIAGDIRLFNSNDKFNGVVGVRANYDLWILKLFGNVIYEQPLTDSSYDGEFSASGGLGIVIFDGKYREDEKDDGISNTNYVREETPENSSGQKITLMIETGFDSVLYEEYIVNILKVIPQIEVEFETDFSFLIGVEMLVDVYNAYLNPMDKYLTFLKLNYVINSEYRIKKTTMTVTPVVTPAGISLSPTPTSTPDVTGAQLINATPVPTPTPVATP